MKIARFDDNRLGLIESDHVKDVTSALTILSSFSYPFPRFDLLIANLDSVIEEVNRLRNSSRELPLTGRNWLSPVANPGKIIAAPVNYLKHLEEAREQKDIHHNNKILEIQKIGLFLKSTSALVGPSNGIKIQHLDRRNDHEAELVVIIGKEGRNISKANAMQHVAGYSCGLDMTVRGPEERSLRKSVDSFAVVGPWLVTSDELKNPFDLDFSLHVDGELRQQANTKDLILGIPELIEFASSFYSLKPGDLLFTGTPEGVAPVLPGQTIETTFQYIGSMTVAVK